MVLGFVALELGVLSSSRLPELSAGQPSWHRLHPVGCYLQGRASVCVQLPSRKDIPRFRWNLLCLSWCLSSGGVTEESASRFFTSFREIFVGESENTDAELSSYEKCFSSLFTFVALCWTCCSSSRCVLSWGAQSGAQHSRCGLMEGSSPSTCSALCHDIQMVTCPLLFFTSGPEAQWL